MRSKIIIISIIAILWALFARWFYVHHIKGCAHDKEVVPIEVPKTLALWDEGKNVFGDFEAFAYERDSTALHLSDNNLLFTQKLVQYLHSNTKKKLLISGVYRNQLETNAIGQERAQQIVNYLSQQGIENERLVLNTSSVDASKWKGGLAFSIENPVITDNDLQQIVISDANFDSNSDVFVPNDDFVRLSAALKIYIAKAPKSTMNITGHTDNQGTDEANVALGLRRANAVQHYFAQQQLNINIRTRSEGERKPIANNDTELGRAQNRRVQCALIKS
jgi:outer membrane protein OmpA-like peptidoglycan-associated protein